MKRRTNNSAGFTLIELLTTLAVVGILLGLLIPALNQVGKTATKVKQKAQFHAIGTALEAFRNDYGDYPPSVWDDDTTDGNNTYYGNYSASQRLAEALVGRDGFGFHPLSQFTEDGKIQVFGGAPPLGTGWVDEFIYYPDFDPSGDDALRQANLAARKGPYLELENANAVTLENLYGVSNYGSLVDSFVLADMYKITKNKATGKMTGSPILYYKANRLKTEHDFVSAQGNRSTYNIIDSLGGLSSYQGLAGKMDSLVGGKHPMYKDPSSFYEQTLNPNFTSPPRPYRSESFILQSAGPDGLYGTTDDVFNFETDN